jgi:hypothetical protein
MEDDSKPRRSPVTVAEEIAQLSAIRVQFMDRMQGDINAGKELAPMLVFAKPGTEEIMLMLLGDEETQERRGEIVGRLRQMGIRTILLLSDAHTKDPEDTSIITGECLMGMLFYDDGTVGARVWRYTREPDGTITWDEPFEDAHTVTPGDRYYGHHGPSFRGGGQIE